MEFLKSPRHLPHFTTEPLLQKNILLNFLHPLGSHLCSPFQLHSLETSQNMRQAHQNIQIIKIQIVG
jgi:hypothetical protein